MAYPTEVKEYAKQLFLTIGQDGEHKYSLQEIVIKIQQEFNSVAKCPDRSTVQRWSNTKDKNTKKTWATLWKNGQRSGLKEAAKEYEKQLDADEKIELHVDAITRKRAQRAIKLCELADNKLESKTVLDNQDIKQIQLAENIFNNLGLESGLEDESSGLSDLAIALQNSRKENQTTD